MRPRSSSCSRRCTSGCCSAGGGEYLWDSRRWRSRCTSLPQGRAAPKPSWPWRPPLDRARLVEAALRGAYPNVRFEPFRAALGQPPALVRLKKRLEYIKRLRVADPRERRAPLVDRLITAMQATGSPCLVQFALTPTPGWFERSAKREYKRHEQRLSAERDQGAERPRRDRSEVESAELRGALDVQHRPLFFGDIRIVAETRSGCEAIASELRAVGAENQLVERGTTIRQALLRPYDRRVARGEGNPVPNFRRGVYASTELAMLWQLPSADFAAVPLARTAVPVAPASPAILRPGNDGGPLRDAAGTVTIHADLRRQNTAVPGTVEQGKTSYLVATIRGRPQAGSVRGHRLRPQGRRRRRSDQCRAGGAHLHDPRPRGPDLRLQPTRG
jgi:hypothetical protein